MGGQVVQSRQAEERIRAVLAFPGGWLVEEEREEQDVTMEVEGSSADQEREAELASLRRLLVPRTVTLLHSLLHSTGQHQQCVALADTVADEGHALYQAFTPDSLRELLVKIRESALAGMEKEEMLGDITSLRHFDTLVMFSRNCHTHTFPK